MPIWCGQFNFGRVIPSAHNDNDAHETPAPDAAAPNADPHSGPTRVPSDQDPELVRKHMPPRKNASTRMGLRGGESFKSISSFLLISSNQASINVLRTSLYEMHERSKYRWILHPLSPFKTAWDLLSAAVVIYYSWLIPFMLCFEWYEMSPQTAAIMKALDVWGFLDIMLRFRTGIIEYGAVVMNPTAIRNHYVYSIWFPIDVVSTLPYEYLLSSNDSNSVSTRKTIKMLKYIKLPRLLRIGRFVKYVRRYKRYSSTTIAINAILFVAHVVGCMWVMILRPCTNADGVVLQNSTDRQCDPGNELAVYWVSFQHGIVSLLGISAQHVESSEFFLSGGYHAEEGIINSSIYIWSAVVSLIGTILTAALFGTIINLVQSMSRVENAFRKKMDQISHEMEALSLPHEIRARVTAYYDYLWINNRTFSEQLNLLNDEGMSLALRQQIAIYLFKDYLQKIPFFQLATDTVLGMICMQLRQVIFMPEDYIIREGDIGKELFMIVKGVVRVMPPKDGPQEEERKILLGEGDFFGEIGVVMEVERTRSVKSEGMAELCILSREGFDKILVEFPEFATAMKRLIIKRVSEMWKTDGRDRIEKMTRLADFKMKKIQAHNNVRRLRSTAYAIQTFRPRLSKLVDPSLTIPEEGEAEAVEEERREAVELSARASESSARASDDDETSQRQPRYEPDERTSIREVDVPARRPSSFRKAVPVAMGDSQDPATPRAAEPQSTATIPSILAASVASVFRAAADVETSVHPEELVHERSLKRSNSSKRNLQPIEEHHNDTTDATAATTVPAALSPLVSRSPSPSLSDKAEAVDGPGEHHLLQHRLAFQQHHHHQHSHANGATNDGGDDIEGTDEARMLKKLRKFEKQMRTMEKTMDDRFGQLHSTMHQLLLALSARGGDDSTDALRTRSNIAHAITVHSTSNGTHDDGGGVQPQSLPPMQARHISLHPAAVLEEH
ncbi:TPA: hypothetical protein N0F65_001577 [Lagenidium giganteum]|uniref:Cyclic nucleotide-binding domain-containing protein n=1 Tax=Lagenidium giganteum TaxID=4803 RepID=A0AAV2Z7Q5_9STRA|nr:TPA: hypothetical protein N0F65_001577 [Lagenidium giganteum]